MRDFFNTAAIAGTSYAVSHIWNINPILSQRLIAAPVILCCTTIAISSLIIKSLKQAKTIAYLHTETTAKLYNLVRWYSKVLHIESNGPKLKYKINTGLQSIEVVCPNSNRLMEVVGDVERSILIAYLTKQPIPTVDLTDVTNCVEKNSLK